jgi:transcriptional regulator with XRE-family HTH domain
MASYAEQVGDRLRDVRVQRGLSLHDVEVGSDGEFKASVLGAYERGERSISVNRLQRLAAFYEVWVDGLLPRIGRAAGSAAGAMALPDEGLCIDLQTLGISEEPEARTLESFVALLQVQRGDYAGKVLTIRREDIRVLAAVLDHSPEELLARLSALGVRRRAG